MNWVEELTPYNQLFTLNEDTPEIGYEGQIFVVVDTVLEVSSNETKLLISYPQFGGYYLGKGICTYSVSKKEIGELFTPYNQSFNELEIECQKERSSAG